MRLTDATRKDLRATERSLARWQTIQAQGFNHDQCALCVRNNFMRGNCQSCVLEIISGTSDLHVCLRITEIGDEQGRAYCRADYTPQFANGVIRILAYLRDYLTAYLNNEDLGE